MSAWRKSELLFSGGKTVRLKILFVWRAFLSTVFPVPKRKTKVTVSARTSGVPTAAPDAQGKTQPRPIFADKPWVVFGICAFLVILVWIAFGQTIRHQFVNFDDDVYIYANGTVQGGLTAENIIWAFTHAHALNWHPLTTISHMLDCQIFGLNAGGHHFTNVLLHAVNAVLLFLVLRSLTSLRSEASARQAGGIWPGAFVAVVFAIHPLRVESVAWASERKDVLAGFFFMLTLLAYVRYARKAWSLARYLPVLFLFALGLMSKPMLVTLPFVLLLLDIWPLGRLRPGAGDGFKKRLIVEKIPLLLFAVAAGLVTFLIQHKAMPAVALAPSFPLRISNAAVSCAAYIGQLFYPANLAVLYPYPVLGISFWKIALSLLFLCAVSITVFFWRRRHPFLCVGWLWYLVMLLPVIGLIQVGSQARADRYTYLPEIGLCVALTWAILGWSATWKYRAEILGASAATIIVALLFAARAQTTHWRDGESLWKRTLACTGGNSIAQNNLAQYFYYNGRYDEAIIHAQESLRVQSNYEDAHLTLGMALFAKGRLDDAIFHLREALKIKPDFVPALNDLGMALFQIGRVDEAIAAFQDALKIEPSNPAVHNNLGTALLTKGQSEAAVAEYKKAVELSPDYTSACKNLAWVLATSGNAAIRDGPRAVQLAEHANQISGTNDVLIIFTLAAAYSEAGKFPEAVETTKAALQWAALQSNSYWVNRLQAALRLYEAGQPFRDTAP